MEQTTCLNCGAELQTKFCGQCGQKRQNRISFRQLASQVYSSFVDFESPFLVSLVELTTKPGTVYREYIAGKRARYFSPLRYCLWLLTLLVAVASYNQVTLIDFTRFAPPEEEMEPLLMSAQAFLNSAIIPMYFVLALLSATLTRLFFRKPYTIAELYLPMLLNYCHCTLLTVAAILFGVFSYDAIIVVASVVTISYMTWAIAGLYEAKSWHTYLKAFAVTVLNQFGILVAISFLAGVLVGVYMS